MILTDSQRYQLESYIKEEFGLGISHSELYDLIAEALVFMSNDEITRLGKSSLNALRRHLRKYRVRQLREKRGHVRPESAMVGFISDLRTAGINSTRRLSEEDQLARLSGKGQIFQDAGLESTELENELRTSEDKLAVWRSRLPAIEYEALEVELKGVTPQLTMGLSEWGRWIFYRRARIRMKWIISLEKTE